MNEIAKGDGIIMMLFNEYGELSGLRLHLVKVVVIPLRDKRLEQLKAVMAEQGADWVRKPSKTCTF